MTDHSTREPTRRRRSLNLPAQTDDTWQRLAEYEGVTMTEALRRALATRWRLHTVLHPELLLGPDNDRDVEPQRLAFVGVNTGRVREVEIL